MMARYHASHHILPFFHHELFHLYHRQFFKDCGTVSCNLWDEGLVTYVASKLTPEATEEVRVLVESTLRGLAQCER